MHGTAPLINIPGRPDGSSNYERKGLEVRRELLPTERIRSVQRSLAAPAFCFFARAFAPFEEPEKPKAYRRGGNSRRYAEKRDKRVGSV